MYQTEQEVDASATCDDPFGVRIMAEGTKYVSINPGSVEDDVGETINSLYGFRVVC